jgi:hypothetical protein
MLGKKSQKQRQHARRHRKQIFIDTDKLDSTRWMFRTDLRIVRNVGDERTGHVVVAKRMHQNIA